MNHFSTYLGFFLGDLIYQLPLLIVLLIGFIISIKRWRKNPHVSLLTLLATLIASISINLYVFYFSVMVWILRPVWELSTLNLVSSIFSILFNALTAVSWVLLLIALFGKGKVKSPVVES